MKAHPLLYMPANSLLLKVQLFKVALPPKACIPPELFAETVRSLPAAGFRGVNVTVPHKEAALAIADRVSERAGAIGAANTLVFEDHVIHAENTDAPALIAALPFAVRERTAVVLGAGGSARATVWALLAEGAAEVRVWNRTPERARTLCDELGATPVTEITSASMTGVDRYGFEMSAITSKGPRPVRLAFANPVSTPEEVRAALISMVQDARSKLG